MTWRVPVLTLSVAFAAAAACSCKHEPAVCCEPLAAAGAALPGTSVYQLAHRFRDQTGTERRLADFRGRPVVLAMIFTHCSFACPAIVADVQGIVARAAAADLHVVLASMDSVRDEPAVLAAFAQVHRLPPERYTLLHGSADAARELAAVLGVRFAAVEGGDFSHSNLLALLDREGRVAARREGLGTDATALLEAIRRLANH